MPQEASSDSRSDSPADSPSSPRSPAAPRSAAARWAPLRRFIVAERRLGERAARRRWSAFAYEFLRFGVKQAWACLFGGVMVALIIATHVWYPRAAALPRYDFLVIAACLVQLAMLAFRLETLEEAKVIFIYHLVGTAMEIFKTGAGSWIYPEPSYLRIGGVPLFTGFMYAAVGSYIARVWRVCDFRFSGHPPLPAVLALALAIYVNFFTHHFVMDLRWLLIAAALALFARSWIWFKVWRRYRRMPLLLACFLTTLFIWIAENIGTVTKTWLYPNQIAGWSPVGLAKLSSWFLLLIVSYALVALVTRPRNMTDDERAALERRTALRSTTSPIANIAQPT